LKINFDIIELIRALRITDVNIELYQINKYVLVNTYHKRTAQRHFDLWTR